MLPQQGPVSQGSVSIFAVNFDKNTRMSDVVKRILQVTYFVVHDIFAD